MKNVLEAIGGIRSFVVALLFAVGTYVLMRAKIEITPAGYAWGASLLVMAAGHTVHRARREAKEIARTQAILQVRHEVELAKATLHVHADSELRRMDYRCRTQADLHGPQTGNRLEHG